MTLPTTRDPKLWLTILYEVNLRGGQARRAAVLPAIRQHFPEITDGDVLRMLKSGAGRWENRISWARQLMANVGFLDTPETGVWRATPAGVSWLEENWRGPLADYSNALTMPKLRWHKEERAGNGAGVSPRRRTTDGGSGSPSPLAQYAHVPRLGRLLCEALRDGAGLNGVEQYALAVVAYEIETFGDACELLGRALSGSLPDDFRLKAQKLRDICIERKRTEREDKITKAKDRIKALLDGDLGQTELTEIRRLTEQINRLSDDSIQRGRS